jgi:Gpi18-like mannosyltransferase
LRASILLTLKLHRDIVAVILSVLVQIPLAVFLGHYYDERSFIDTGYLVSSGLTPYIPHMITVFSNPDLMGINPIIGYPPLWPLLLGLIYRLSYNIAPNIFFYNFAIKIPVIASNIALAYVTKTGMQRLNMPQKKVQFAWFFLLFNPFTLLTTTAWGEFDTLIALLCVASLYFLSKGMIGKSSLLLSLSIVLKPISLPLIGLPLLFSTPQNRRKNLIYTLISSVVVVTLWFLPFNLLGWMVPSSPTQVTSYFKMAGGMTLFNIVEIFQKTATIPVGLEFLGYLWMPALILGYYLVYRNPPKTMYKLVESAVFLLFIFFLTRSWLSEPNINVLLPLLLILFGSGKINSKNLHLAWIIPFVFLFLNYAVPQLFFLVYPSIIPAIGTFDLQIGVSRVIARFAVTVVWYIFALSLLSQVLSKNEGN